MTLNSVNIHTIKIFYYNGSIEDLDSLEKAMIEDGIDTNKVDILNIVTAVNDYGQCESEEASSYDDSVTITLSYSYIIYYTIDS